MDVGRAIYKILADNNAVSSMVSTRITPNVMTQRSAFPFIVYDVTNDIPEGQKDSVAKLDIATVMVSAYADNYKDSNILGNYIRTALDRVQGNYNGVNIQSINFENYDDIFDDASGSDGIYRKALNFNVRIINDINNIYSLYFDKDDGATLDIDGVATVLDTEKGSISLWTKADAVGNIFTAFADSENYISIAAGVSAVTLNYVGDGVTKTATASDGIISDSLWHHIVATWHTSSGGLKIYLDGDLKDTQASVPTVIPSLASASVASDSDGSNFYGGYVDEVSIWNQALSASLVTTYYNDGFPTPLGAQSNLIGWWRMGDGATYPTIPDETDENKNGTMASMSAADIVADVP